MDDLISRSAAIDAHRQAAYWQDAERKIAELPAVDAIPVEMADFVQTMKDWRRMCNACQTERKDICGICGCYPAGNYAPCAMKSMDKEADLARDNLYFERLEKKITEWAIEHPEPVYPTWYEWLTSIGAVTRKVRPDVASNLIETGLLDPIPADIAEKLGVEPKESV